jgi:hypothetical protein
MPITPLGPGLNCPKSIPWPPRWSTTALNREYLIRTRRRNCRPHLHALQGDGLLSVVIGSWKLTWWTGNRAATCAWVLDIMSSLAHSWEETLGPGPYRTGRRCFARSPSPHPVVTLMGKTLCAGPPRCLPSALAAVPVLPSRSAQRGPPPPKLSPRSPPWRSRTIRRKTSREGS